MKKLLAALVAGMFAISATASFAAEPKKEAAKKEEKKEKAKKGGC